jgi:hypothetical protein
MGMEQSLSTQLLLSETPSTSTQKIPNPAGSGEPQIQAGTDVRIYRDGLLMARCRTQSSASPRLFVRTDPLPYPVNTRLEIEFVSGDNRVTGISRLPATVIHRSTSGIELKIGPGL